MPAQDATPPGAPSDNTTLVEVLRVMADDGFAANLTVTDGGAVRCPACRQETPPDEAKLVSMRRLEGASDPADMQAVLALRCPNCDTGGVAVVNYGPEASMEEAALLTALGDGDGGHGRPGDDGRPGRNRR
jgi:hypothetical protein